MLKKNSFLWALVMMLLPFMSLAQAQYRVPDMVLLKVRIVDNLKSSKPLQRMPAMDEYDVCVNVDTSVLSFASSLTPSSLEIVFSETGSCVFSKEVDEGECTVSIPALEAGKYTVRFMKDNTLYWRGFTIN